MLLNLMVPAEVKAQASRDTSTGTSSDQRSSFQRKRSSKQDSRKIKKKHKSDTQDLDFIDGENTGISTNGPGPRISSLFTSNREISTTVTTSVAVSGTASNAPLKADTFEELNVPGPLLSHLKNNMRISRPTNIQKRAMPRLLKHESDLFIHAQTGSGKTLAYWLPILTCILSMNERLDRHSGTFALVIAPTRELAAQIHQVASELTQCCHYLVPCLLIGGERKKSEKARLRKGCNFIIGTPGRILDHLENTKSIAKALSETLRYVVLDEGDKLMELGFEETIEKILEHVRGISLNTDKYPQLPKQLIRVLCSATMNGRINKLKKTALDNCQVVSNQVDGSTDNMTTIPDQLVQKVTIVPPKLRLVTLVSVLNNISKRHSISETTRTIVFLSCSDSVDFHFDVFSGTDQHYRNLIGDSVRALTEGNTIFPCFNKDKQPNVVFYKLHGSLSQAMRTSTLQNFSNSKINVGKHLILFCTDVASRGLDLPQVSTVVELDPPFAVEDHLHRIGRTARAGEKGESLLFLFPGEEEGYLEHIKPYHPKGWEFVKYEEDLLRPTFENTSVSKRERGISTKTGDKDHLWDNNATTWHLNVERRILEDSTLKNLAVSGFTSHIRAYATHIHAEKKFFNVRFLHLGHLAKSFGLRETPKAMGLQVGKTQSSADPMAKNGRENPKDKMFRVARMAVKQSADEFNY